MPKNKIIFILGGARSGKSSYALQRARAFKKVVFVATAQALDTEMRQRIRRHRKDRPRQWQTIECPQGIADAIGAIADKDTCVIIDCLTLWVSNLLLKKHTEIGIMKEMDDLLRSIRHKGFSAIMVSNEVGLGIVPGNALARRFRDVAGKVNQSAAQEADEVVFMVSGLPLHVKKGKE